MPAIRTRRYSTGTRTSRNEEGRDVPFDFGEWLRWYRRNRLRRVYYNSDGEEASGDEAEDETEKQILRVSSVDLNVARNAAAHHTDEYDAVAPAAAEKKPTLVVRRGQPFDVTLVFNRTYAKDEDDIQFHFETGTTPMKSNGSMVQMRLSDEDKELSWGAKVKSQKDKTLTVTFTTPPYCFIGRWNFSVSAVKKSVARGTELKYEHKSPIVILLNAWCKDDLVYMEDEDLLKEYVLAETGGIWRGNSAYRSAKPWNFGQFEPEILDCVLDLLEEGVPKVHTRGNPIQIARRMSALVNAPNDKGVLVGRWDGKYDLGKTPGSWAGSVKILQQYYKTKEPVMYGQCWVFSGVLTTVCRALGLPARSVTNFASAHDTDCSVTIDYYFDEEDNEIDYLSTDSIWNFHVWNDVWMKRPDLPPEGYDGWQAIDATPQETSDGIYCTGPCSLNALKHGSVYLPYDGRFVFAEMNADQVAWLLTETGDREFMRKITQSVGLYMSTNCPEKLLQVNKGDKRLDVTSEYKFPEGSDQNRAAVRRAYAHGENKEMDIYEFKGEEDVEYTLTVNDAEVGEDGVFRVSLFNKSKEKRNVKGQLHIRKQYYTGVTHRPFMGKKFAVQLEPGKTVEEVMTVSAEELLNNVVDHFMYKITLCGSVKETGRHLSDMRSYRLSKPELKIECKDACLVGEKVNVTVSFKNKMPKTLTECELVIEYPGQGESRTIPQPNVEAKGAFVASFDVTPKKVGRKYMIVNFNSKQIDSVTDNKVIHVMPEPMHM